MTDAAKFELWLEFEHWIPQPEDDPADEFANVQVLLPDGRRYAMSVWTFKFVQRARLDATDEADRDQPAEYLLGPDLLVERLDRPTLERVVTAMLARGDLRAEWLCPSDEGDT